MTASLAALPQANEQADLLEASLRQVEESASLDGAAGCLVPLLTALRWRGDPNQLLESLPHFVGSLDMDDVRDVLARLGFATRPARTRVSDLDARALPCLFETADGRAIAILSRIGQRSRVFDPEIGAETDLRSKSLCGTAFVLDHASSSSVTEARQDGSWFATTAGRFRRLVATMFAITLFVNLLAIVVPLTIMIIYDQVVGRQNAGFLPCLAIGVAVAMLSEFALRVLRAWGQAHLSSRLEYLIGAKAMAHVMHLPYAVVERAPVGKQLARLKEFESLREFFSGPLVSVLFDLPFVVLFVVTIGLIAGPVVVVPVILIGLYGLLALATFPAMRRRVKLASVERSERQTFVVESLTEMRGIKIMGSESVWHARFRDISARAAFRTFRANYLTTVVQTLSHMFMVFGAVAVLGLSVLRVDEGLMTMGALIATMALTWRVLAPVQSAFNLSSRLEQVILSVRQLDDLLRFRLEREPDQYAGERKLFTGAVSFNRVSLRYLPKHEPALRGVSFTVRPGEVVALAGSSGSGKSSLLGVALRLYEPQSGTVTLDGIDTRQLDPAELRRAIAYVSQETQILYGTVAQNLRFGNFSAGDEALREACRVAGFLEDIERLPEGFETRIGDNRSARLPAGFHQRLALARAYLSASPVLLLDEAANALDEDGDRKFRDAVSAMRGSRTIILVTHRPSHMRVADRVVVLDAGEVIDEGPPDEIVAKLVRAAA